MQQLSEVIDQWGKKEPERLAYQDDELNYTYGELSNYSDNLAAYLGNKLNNRGPIVVFGNLEFEMLAAFLSATKAGHAYIPIEGHTPTNRIELILQVAQPSMVLAVEAWPSEIEAPCPVLEPAELRHLMHTPQPNIELVPVQGDETYYIIFTSGTTGVPKGVQISHDNLASFLAWELQDFGLTKGMRFLSQAPLSFDLSVMSVYPALVTGGVVVPLQKAVIEDFKELFARLPQLDVDVWVSTPSFMDICLMEPTFDQVHVPSIKIFEFCGEEMMKKTAEKLLERFPEAHIFNTYGPTETTVAVSQIELTPEILAEYERVPIGYVKEDTKAYIMEDEQILETGKSGEIVIAGPSVSKGYLHNPEKTQAAFFLLGGVPAYRTGDAGQMIPAGLLLYQGRLDFQVKLHGFRIELEDIDHHLENVSYVRQATVVPKYFEHKVQQLVAFVVAEPNDFAKDYQLTKAIKEELAQTVMDYMIPQKFVYLDQLPRTANGKIDRKGLMNEVNS